MNAAWPEAPIHIILNPSSGRDNGNTLRETIERSLEEEGRRCHIVELGPDETLQEAGERIARHAREQGALLVAAGGDGTVNAVASLCCEHALPMGVIPLGTFNYFAREMGIPTVPAEAAKLLAHGRLKPVAAGMAGDRLFLNNASFGLYSTIIRKREQASSRFGRMRIVAVLSAIASLWQANRLFAIRFEVDGHEDVRRTSLVFVGNNTMQLENLGLDVARCTKADKLAVVLLKRTSRYETLRLLFRSLTRTLSDEARLEEFCADHFSVDAKRKRIDLVIDGEIVRCTTPLRFRIIPAALQVMVPQEDTHD